MGYYETEYKGNYALTWENDHDSSDPREEVDSRVGHAIKLGDRHELDGEDHPLGMGARHFWEMSMHPERDFMRWAKIFHEAIVIQGSGRSVWYITGDEIKDLLFAGWASVDHIKEALETEMSSHEAWVDGDVYRYIVHEFTPDEDDPHVDPRDVDFGDDRWDAIEWCGSWFSLEDAWTEGLGVLNSIIAHDIRKNYAEALSLFGWKVAA